MSALCCGEAGNSVMALPKTKEIRETFVEFRNYWQDIYEDAELDMQAISTEGPWTAEDRSAREDAGRPCIHLDQINQYINQTIGNARKNKRAVKAMPKGDGADEKLAAKRSSLIMGIEEKSQAQPIYLYTLECMLQRSLGFAVIRTEFSDFTGFDQDIRIRSIANPHTAMVSPYFKQPDASDIQEAFLVDRMAKSAFKQKYPKAEAKDFSPEMMREEHMTDWITEKQVQVAEYWKVEYDRSKLLLVEIDGRPMIFTEEEWKTAKEFGRGEVKRERTVEKPRVVQYLTNGIEILDEVPWAGTRIPIISCFGPERWRNQGGTAKRTLLSMVRFARDPQMLFDFLATQETELAGMVPKVPYKGYKGQFDSDREVWESLNKVPYAYVQADLIIDGATGGALPLPSREEWSAPFQEYELAKDAAGRHVQAAMGITPLPTAAQRRTEKSGVALERIDNMENLGTMPFLDRYENCFLYNMGWQINELITPILDTEREMPVMQPDGSRGLIRVVGNTSHPIENGVYNVQGMPENHIHTGDGEFDVTISTGPSYQSEREEQSDFVDQMIENMPNLPQPQTPGAKVLALAIRMRPDLGPIGKQIADVFDPPDESQLPPEAQAIVQQLQAQVQELSQENQALHMDRAGRVLEQQTKLQIEQMKGDITKFQKNLDYITRIVVAQISAKSKADDRQAQLDAQRELDQLGFEHEKILSGHDSAHELAMRESAPPEPQQPGAGASVQP